MPRKKHEVKTTYGKASKTPSARSAKPVKVEMRTPKPLNALTAYVIENEDSGLPVRELIEQFQEYDCEHEWEESAWLSGSKFYRCRVCGKTERRG